MSSCFCRFPTQYVHGWVPLIFSPVLNLSENCREKDVLVQGHNASLHSRLRQTALKLIPKGLDYPQTEFMFLPFSNTISSRLSEFSYILNAKNLHRNFQIRPKRGTRTIYHLLNKMTANISLWPNSLT